LTLTPPLIITREELEEAFQIVESAIGQVARADS
jgi:4-aminobutyrate aminotransferase-like enzyme